MTSVFEGFIGKPNNKTKDIPNFHELKVGSKFTAGGTSYTITEVKDDGGYKRLSWKEHPVDKPEQSATWGATQHGYNILFHGSKYHPTYKGKKQPGYLVSELVEWAKNKIQ